MSNEMYNVLARATDGLYEGAAARPQRRRSQRVGLGGHAARRLLLR
jgi:hypothetical protein